MATTSFFYPRGWVFSGVAERLGVPIGIRIRVMLDAACAVYIATSPDVKGLVVESETFEQLIAETNDLLPTLIGHKSDVGLLTDYHLLHPLIAS